jgi:hypothetical protein
LEIAVRFKPSRQLSFIQRDSGFRQLPNAIRPSTHPIFSGDLKMTKFVAVCLAALLCSVVSLPTSGQEKEKEIERVEKVELKKIDEVDLTADVVVIQDDGKKGKYRIVNDEAATKGKKRYQVIFIQDDDDSESGKKKIQKKRVIKRKSSGDDDGDDDDSELPAEVRAALKKHGIDLNDANVEVDVEKSSDGTQKYKIQATTKDDDLTTKKVIEIQIRKSEGDDEGDALLRKRVESKQGVYKLKLRKDDDDRAGGGGQDFGIRVMPKLKRVAPAPPVRQIQLVGSPKQLEQKVNQLERRMKSIERKLDLLLKKMDR